MEPPKTLHQAVKFFGDPDNCDRYMKDVPGPDGEVRCPRYDSERVIYLAKQRRLKCYSKHPRPQFSLKVGTIFEDSPLPLEKWMMGLLAYRELQERH